ncbi:MAG TPA: hypothetical protein VGO89_21935 [Streptomyces sp.]|nr:hypothetical protein [Streptomyces sp.]
MTNSTSARHPVTVTRLPVVRCAVCRRTVAHRPGDASVVLTKHYERAHPEMVGPTGTAAIPPAESARVKDRR